MEVNSRPQALAASASRKAHLLSNKIGGYPEGRCCADDSATVLTGIYPRFLECPASSPVAVVNTLTWPACVM
jgi:hypothetical protein